MANALEGGSGVRNPRTGTNTRSPGRFASLSRWTPENQAAAAELTTARFGGLGATTQPRTYTRGSPVVPDYAGPVYSGLTSEQWKQQAAEYPNMMGGQYEGLPADEEEKKQEQLVRQNRTERKNALAERNWRPDTDRMTWKEYNALTPSQRAAVDFNTMLVRAVRKDKKMDNQYPEVSTDENLTYDKTLEKMFGSSDRGSKTYAPETLGLLKQIGYHDTSADLDDFLNLKAAITSKDLADLPTVAGVPQAVAYSGQAPERTEELGVKREIAASTLDMEKTLAKGNEMLASINQLAAQERWFTVSKLGGTENQIREGLGFGEPKLDPETGAPADLNTFFQKGYNDLSDKAKDPKETLGILKSTLSPSEMDAFLNYADARSNNAMRFGLPQGEIKGVTYRKPEEFRDILKLRGGITSGQANR